jgi:hypothetical protein
MAHVEAGFHFAVGTHLPVFVSARDLDVQINAIHADGGEGAEPTMSVRMFAFQEIRNYSRRYPAGDYCTGRNLD